MKKLSLTLQFVFFTLFLNAQTISEINKIRPTDVIKGDYFGENIDIAGDYAIISAKNKDQIINGNQTVKYAGAAFIYYKNEAGDWTETQKLAPLNMSINNQSDFFGTSVAISETYAIVGATKAIHNEHINEEETGVVYIYKKDTSGNWLEVQKIKGSDSKSGDQFGFEVAIEGDHILVGAIAHTINQINYAGAIYAFKRNNKGVWEETQKITKPVKDERSRLGSGFSFGFTIAMSGNRAIFGHNDNLDVNDPSDITRNVAFIYERNDNGIWTEVQKLIPSDSPQSGSTGLKLDIQGDYVIAAAQGYNRSGNDRLGVAHVFKRNEAGIWSETQKITPSSQQVGPSFGSSSVSIDNGLISIGAYLDNTNGQTAGATYLYKLNETTGVWSEFQQVVASDIQAGTEFGWGLAMNNSDMLISAWNSSSSNQNRETVYSYKICNNTTIIDSNFEQWLVNENIDSDGKVNGVINNCDVEKITELNISPLQGISNLTGISAFCNLEILSIPENDLVTLDLSNNTKLTSVNVFYNFLEQIDITNCNELVSLNVSDNFLNKLDLSGINDLQSMDARTNAGLTCIAVKDIAEAIEKSSGRRPKWRVDRSTNFDLNCPSAFRKMSLSNLEKTRIRNRNKREVKSNITVFPTRVINGKLTILAKNQFDNVSIYDLQGNLFKEYTEVSKQKDIDVSILTPGLYVAKIHQNEHIIIKKFVIGK